MSAILDGTYFIRVGFSTGVVFDVPDGSAEDGVLIQQYGYHGGPNQRWQFTNVGADCFTIVSSYTGKALDVPGGFPILGMPIQQYTFHGGENQQWLIETIPAQSGDEFPVPEHHRIRNRASGLALDIANGTLEWHAKIQQWTPHMGFNQVFTLLPFSG